MHVCVALLLTTTKKTMNHIFKSTDRFNKPTLGAILSVSNEMRNSAEFHIRPCKQTTMH